MSGPVYHVLRAVLEAKSPLSIASGETSRFKDVLLARDANGLPAIPADSLAGVLRRHLREYFAEDEVPDLLGYSDSRNSEIVESRLHVASGCVHDHHDKPVEGLIDPQVIADDGILSFLADEAPLTREHVAIGHRGTARTTLKYDRSAVPIGTRFSTEFSIEGQPQDYEVDRGYLTAVAAVLGSADLHIGGATRRGYGSVELVKDAVGAPRAFIASFDRITKDGRRNHASFAGSAIGDFGHQWGFEPAAMPKPLSPRPRVEIKLELMQRDGTLFRMGSGGLTLPDPKPAAKAVGEGALEAVDDAPQIEPWIVYKGSAGGICGLGIDGDSTFRVPIPASGIKGALSHRTEFELNRLLGNWCRQSAGLAPSEEEPARGASALFGAARSTKAGATKAEPSEHAGLVFIDDAYLEIDTAQTSRRVGKLVHSSLDRFTQGVRGGLLFEEAGLFGAKFTLRLSVQPNGGTWPQEMTRQVRQAFHMALVALAQGRLAIGAGDGDGMGRFELINKDRYADADLRAIWSDKGAWLDGGADALAGSTEG